MTPELFISYSRADSKQALTLVAELRSEGYEVWIDQAGIDAATIWSKEIAQAMQGCSAVILLLSPSSVASKNVAKELSVAVELNKQIIPVEVESATLTGEFLYHLSGLQRTSIANSEAILKAVKNLAGDHKHPKPEPELSPSQPSLKRLAVLPFEDLSPSHDNEWFSDGLTDELISTLTKLHQLFVIDRQTSREYKKSTMKMRDIARELNVGFIISGAVRKADKNILVQAALIDTGSHETLWDEKFTGTMDDIFEIQEKIAKEIAEGLSLRLTAKEKESITKKPTENIEAYELYLRGASYSGKDTKEDDFRAIRLYEAAIGLDGGFALAYVSLSLCHSEIFRFYERTEKHLDLAESAALEAVRLDSNLSAAHTALALVYLYRGKAEKAIQEAEEAMKLQPEDSRAHYQLGFIYEGLSRYEESAAAFERAVELKPDYLQSYFNLCLQYDRLKDSSNCSRAAVKALTFYEKYLLRHPDDESTHMNYASLLEFSSKREESIKEIVQLIDKPGVDSRTLYNASCLLIRQGDQKQGTLTLRRAVENGFSELDSLHMDSDLNPIRMMPEFQEILSLAGEKAHLEETGPS
ncbi:MAG: TIR domain-containing protein [Candidatus Kapaibacterium sp.]